jgi:hypothetical protein
LTREERTRDEVARLPYGVVVVVRRHVFVRDVGQQHLQVRQQGRDFLRVEDGGVDQQLRAAGRHEGGIGLDLLLDLLERRLADACGGLDRRGLTRRRIRSGFPSHVGPLRPSLAGVRRLSGRTLP